MFTVAPTASPTPILIATSPTSVTVAWNGLPCQDQNGPILEYEITVCQSHVTNCSRIVVVNANSNVSTLERLLPSRTYGIGIRAITTDGSLKFYGPYSSTLPVLTQKPQSKQLILIKKY